MNMKRGFLLTLLTLALSCILANAQAQLYIEQYSESVTGSSEGAQTVSYMVAHSYPSPANPASSGMNTRIVVAYQWIWVGGGTSDTLYRQVYQRTYPGYFWGVTSHTWTGDFVQEVLNQKPSGVYGIYWTYNIDSTVYIPGQSSNDHWHSQQYYRNLLP